jgi:hypothetical protein
LGGTIVTFWFFKWMNNQEGTAGYVMVSATNERDVKFKLTSDGKPIKITNLKPIFKVISKGICMLADMLLLD